MTDSVQVFDPGDRITDSSDGSPLSGAVVRFYDAGTTTPKTVYADKDLLTSLGTSVTTDSLGYPTSDGSTKTLVYTNTSSYKITIENEDGVVLVTHDNVKGAVATVDEADLTVVSTTPVVTKSLDYTVLTTDQSSVFVVNCTGGDVTLTLPSAVTAGDGWFIDVQHAGSANQAIIAAVSSQTITSGNTSYADAMVLALSGESVRLVSDGSNWRVTNHTGPHIKRATGVLQITDRLTAPPGSEVEGSLYLISGSPTGDWSGFAQHDIVQYTSSAWVKFTPPTDAGWLAYVVDENTYYSFVDSAWVKLYATTSFEGLVELATSAEAVTATDTARVAPVGTMHHHPGVAKVWGVVTYSAGTPTLQASYNVNGITDTAEGQLTVTIENDFSSANYVVVATAAESGTTASIVSIQDDVAIAAGSFVLVIRNASNNTVDRERLVFACFGTLA